MIIDRYSREMDAVLRYAAEWAGLTPAELERAVLQTPNAFAPTSHVEDWGSGRGQGKRFGGQVMGGMADPPRGKKTYHDIFGNLPDYAAVGQELHAFHSRPLEYPGFAVRYLKARSFGMEHEDAINFAIPGDYPLHAAEMTLVNHNDRSVPEAGSLLPEPVPVDTLVFKNRGKRLKDLSSEPGVWEHVRAAVRSVSPASDFSNFSAKKVPDSEGADHTVYFVTDNQSYAGRGHSVEAATRDAIGKLTSHQQAVADFEAGRSDADREAAAEQSRQARKEAIEKLKQKFPNMFGQ